MANILVTSARAPVALELIRNFGKHGHSVIACDSLTNSIGFKSKYIFKKVITPSPRFNFDCFRKIIIATVEKNKIDIIFPTCEEVFYLALINEEIVKSKLFSPNLNTIRLLHSKIDILSLVENLNIKIPKTEIYSKKELIYKKLDISNSIIKPEFSRFGNNILIKSNKTDLDSYIRKSNMYKSDSRYLLQEYIAGKEISSYSIAVDGRAVTTILYHPKYKIDGSGIYFEQLQNIKAENFISDFIKKYKISGQISFDFILSNYNLYLLECNPRSTSGIHFLKEEDIYSAISGNIITTISSESKMLKTAMRLFKLKRLVKDIDLAQWKIDQEKAEDIFSEDNDSISLIDQLKSYFEIKRISNREKISLSEASTWDIECNGF